VIAQGVREATRDHLRQAPGDCSYFLWISLPADAVDVNVHPTKREVRFKDPAAVRSLVGASVREALRADRSSAIPAAASQAQGAPEPRLPSSSRFPPVSPDAAAAPLAADGCGAERYEAASQPALPLAPSDLAPGVPDRETPGRLFGTYLICPGPGGLVLVDQHAAHERILYERFLSRPPGGACQQLLEPLIIELTPAEESAVEAVRPALEGLGIALEPFGPRSRRVVALPPELPAAEAPPFIRAALAVALECGAAPRVEEFRHRAAALLACHAAVRAHRRLGAGEIAALLADLARTDNPGVCPHGRPTTITIDRAEIERRFKRT